MLDILGNVGDFVGGIGVVVTLIYLAVQIRQNSKVVKSSAAEAVMQSTSEFFRSSAESRDLAQVVSKAMRNYETLDEAELTQFHLWIFGWFRLVELCYHHYSAGHIPDNFWSGQVAHLGGLMQLPPIKHLWEIRKKVFSEDFRAFVDSVRSSDVAIDAVEMMQFYEHDADPTRK